MTTDGDIDITYQGDRMHDSLIGNEYYRTEWIILVYNRFRWNVSRFWFHASSNPELGQ